MTAPESLETLVVQDPQTGLGDHEVADLHDGPVAGNVGMDGTGDLHDASDWLLNEATQTEEDAKIAFGEGVLISSNGHKCVVLPGQIIVVCREPGFRRGGIEHPAMHVYRRHELSKKQLEQMRAEPLLEIIEVG